LLKVVKFSVAMQTNNFFPPNFHNYFKLLFYIIF